MTVRIENAAIYVYNTEPYYLGHLGSRKNCPDYRGVLISGVEDVLGPSIANHLGSSGMHEAS